MSGLVWAPHQSASAALGELGDGVRVSLIMRGQFSLLDVLRAVIEQAGPSDVDLSAWTTGVRDVDAMDWLVTSGAIRSCRFLLDYSFPQREAAQCAAMIRRFGASSIVICKSHLKAAAIRGGRFDAYIRGSCNLNRNPRYENVDVDCDAGLAAGFHAFCDAISAEAPRGMGAAHPEFGRAFALALEAGDWREIGAGGSAPPASGGIEARFTEGEKLALRAAAERDGLSPGAWLRRVALWAAR